MSIRFYPTSIRRNSVFSDFDNAINDIFGAVRPFKANKHTYNYVTTPKANIKRSDGGFSLELAAPGFSKDEFDINVENDVLTISINNETPKNYNSDVVLKEYSYNSFSRSWTLPENTNVENINARYEAGILSLYIPVEGSQPVCTKINID